MPILHQLRDLCIRRCLETNIAIAAFNGCPDLQKKLTRLLNETFNRSTPPLKITQLFGVNDKITARNIGRNTDLVIWGSCGSDEASKKIHFEIISARGTPEIYEPESLEFMLSTSAQLDRIVRGVSYYVYRDVINTQAIFKDMVEHDFNDNDNSLVKLMLGNSLMFSRSYKEAIEVYSDALEKSPDKAYFHYNLGIASMNFLKENKKAATEYEHTEKHFKKALEIDPNFTLANVAIGLMNIMAITSDHPIPNPEEALDLSKISCKKGLLSNEDKTVLLAKYCLNELKITQHAMNKMKNTTITLDYSNYQNNSPWSAPLISKAYVDSLNWMISRDPAALISIKQKLKIALGKSIKDVHTKFTIDRHNDAADFYHLLLEGDIN